MRGTMIREDNNAGQFFAADDELVTVRTSKAVLKVSARTVRRMAANGDIRACKVGGSLRISRKSLYDYLQAKFAEYAYENGI